LEALTLSQQPNTEIRKRKIGDPIQGKPVSKILEMNLHDHCFLSLSLSPSVCVDLFSLFVLED